MKAFLGQFAHGDGVDRDDRPRYNLIDSLFCKVEGEDTSSVAIGASIPACFFREGAVDGRLRIEIMVYWCDARRG